MYCRRPPKVGVHARIQLEIDEIWRDVLWRVVSSSDTTLFLIEVKSRSMMPTSMGVECRRAPA
jgi:hypothetical protein